MKNLSKTIVAIKQTITTCLLILFATANSYAGCTSIGSVVCSPSNATVCQGGSVTFTASNGVGYLWNTGATTQSIMVNATGYYSVTITDGEGCTATVQKYATILAATGSVVCNPSNGTTCQGGNVTFTASGGTSYAWSTGETTAQINANTTGYYTVTITNSNGCTRSIQKYATIITPTGSVTSNPANATICEGSSVLFSASGGAAYAWNTGETTSQISVTTTGYYTVTITNANSCTKSIQKYATILPPTGNVIAYPSNATVCPGGTVTFTANGGTSYAWSTGATDASISTSNIGYYTVTITNGNGCKKTIQKYVSTEPAPNMLISFPGTQPKTGDTVSLFVYPNPNVSAGNIPPYTYQWTNNGVPVQLGTTDHIVVTVGSNTSTYCAVVTNANGCSASVCKTVGPNGVHREGSFDEPSQNVLSKTLNATIYPNPFNNEVMIKYSLKKEGQVSMTLMDITGRIVGKLIEAETQGEGLHDQKINAESYQLKAGIYILKITSDSDSEILELNYSGK